MVNMTAVAHQLLLTLHTPVCANTVIKSTMHCTHSVTALLFKYQGKLNTRRATEL